MLKKTSSEIITQLIDISNKLDSQSFSQPLEILNGSSIGKHIRHIIEFYNCLLAGYETGIVNYDAREHNLLLENDKILATDSLQTIAEKINNCTEKQLLLIVNFSDNENTITEIPTSCNRELIYNIEHTVHHAAIIKIALKNCFPEINVPENFGIAYSTIRFSQKQRETETHTVQ